MMKRIKQIISVGIILISSIAQAQLSPTENYIYVKTYLDYNTITNQPSKISETVQYFDGLGKPKQVVDIKASPTGKDIVTPILYDGFGRQTRDYLPVPQSSTNNGAIYGQSQIVNDFPVGDPAGLYTGEKAFSEKTFEKSPLDRILDQKQIGAAWVTKPLLFGYSANNATDVRKYTTTTSFIENRTNSKLTVSNDVNSLNGFYKANQLYKNSVKDEDGNETIEFKNGKGETVLIRKVINATENADTYYIYNEYSQLAFVIPPKASFAIKSLSAGLEITNTILNDLSYQYHYDGKGRVVEKKIPGKGWEYMVYDKADRLIMSQDAEMNKTGKWLFTKYDKFSRVVYTGIAVIGAQFIRDQVQYSADYYISQGQPSNEIRNTTGFTNSGMLIYYGNTVYPTDIEKVLSVNYYDTYPGYDFNPTFPTDVLGELPITAVPNTEGISIKSLSVMSLVKNIEDDNWTRNYSYYDKRGRVISTYSINHLGGRTKVDSKLDFAGVVQKMVTTHKRLDADTDKIIIENFTYDNQNRLLAHDHKVDSNPTEILTQNNYNELSQLRNKKVGGTNMNLPLQSIDYAYNIKGWMTKINDLTNLNGKLFGYEIKYTNPINSSIAPGRFNGNIAEVDWKNSSEDILKRYDYEYDSLNRLKNAFYKEPTTGNDGQFDEYLTYDLNGNISNLKRTAVPIGQTTPTLVDNLDYQYTGNRLSKVIENQLNSTGYEGGNNLIDYDLNGNMINMNDKGINSISYNYLSLSNSYSITQNDPFGGVSSFGLDYLYRADGVKVRKTNSSGGNRGNPIITKNITDYLDGFQYKYSEITQCTWCRTSVAFEQEAYKDGGLVDAGKPITPQWVLDFVSTTEGFYSFTEKRYIYQYRDHLGNTRVSYAKNSAGVLETIDTNNYYAFGMSHIGGLKGLLGGYLNYKYSGKELQETGMYDYGARIYIPDLGRWGVVDPLAETSRRWSPYHYAFNNPISFIDPDGRQGKDVILRGDAAKEAFEQLKNAASNLNLKMDSNGKVTGTIKKGGKATDAESTLLNAMGNKSVVVEVTAQSSNIIESDNTALSGGAFRGSTINSSLDSSLEGSPNQITHASQIINPDDLGTEDTFYEAVKGVGVVHEILEAYSGAINSPGAINILGKQNRDFGIDSYLKAHNNANELDPRINYNLQVDNVFSPKTSDGTRRIERTMYKQVNGINVAKSLKTIEIKRR